MGARDRPLLLALRGMGVVLLGLAAASELVLLHFRAIDERYAARSGLYFAFSCVLVLFSRLAVVFAPDSARRREPCWLDCCCAGQSEQADTVIALPRVGGLHHRYERRAA